MPLTRDESRALAFVALLLLLAAAARAARREPAVEWAGAPPVDVDSLGRAAHERMAAEERRARPLAPGERIDPNAASEEELDRLPGIGRAVARRMVEAREEAPFRSLAELRRVRGIGAATIRRLAPYLRLPDGGAASPPAGPGPAGPPPLATPLADPHPDDRAPDASRDARAAAREGAGRPTARRPSAARAAAAPLDLNRATAAELEALPGIGPALARRIIAYRDSAGRFATVGDLARVAGIGPATLERLRPLLRVEP